MYKIKDFKIGDKIYKHTEAGWKYNGSIAKVTDECYGMRVDSITGIIMIRKDLFELQGYIGESKI